MIVYKLYAKLNSQKTPHISPSWVSYEVSFMRNFEKFDYRQTSNINDSLVGNKIVSHSDEVGAAPITQMYLEHRLSALLQLHLRYRLNIWLQWIGQRKLQGDTRNI